jgi:hypothetical protein
MLCKDNPPGVKHGGQCRLSLFVAGGLALGVTLTPAVADVFTLDTNQSSLTISGTVQGASLAQQGAGSLTTHYGGAIEATQTVSSIQFTGQSLVAAMNTGNWQPLDDGSVGVAPANYGASVNLAAGLVKVKATLRSLALDVTSPALTLNRTGQFASTNLTFLIPSNANSALSYLVTGLISSSGSTALSGQSTNNVTSLATLVTDGQAQTLTIPVNAQFTFSASSTNDTILNLAGQLVAFRTEAAVATAPVLQSLTVQSQVLTLQWQAPAGQQFQVQSSTDLMAWQTNAVNVTSGSSNYTWSGPATGANGYFRLKQ